MGKEVEKKYLVKRKPDNLEKYKKVGIKQWYITKEDDSVTNRLRLYDTGECIFELKKGHYMFREEIAFQADFKEFEELIKWAPNLSKDRYILIDNEMFQITLDVYKEQLEGLLIMEVEGKGNDAFNNVFNWEVPKEWTWVEKEVSDDNNYSNNILAIKNMIKPKNLNRLYEIIDDVVRDDARDEAKGIIDLMSDKDASEIEMYYDTDSFNVICSHLDKVKYDLSKEGKITINEDDNFGHLPDAWTEE